MRKPNLELKRAIDGMISEGHTINEISEMLSLPLFTVETIANKIAEEKEKVAKRKQEREQKVMTLVSEGKTYKEISEITGWSMNTVRNYACHYKSTYTSMKAKKDKDLIISMLRDGYTCKAIARELGISESGFFQKIKTLNIDTDAERAHYSSDKIKRN